jgi:hypothetical protein
VLACDAPAQVRVVRAPLHDHGAPVGADARIEARLIDALAADRLGHEGAVCIPISEAVNAAKPEEIRRPFLAAGALLADLFGRHWDLVRAHTPFADWLAQEATTRSASAGPSRVLVEPITER